MESFEENDQSHDEQPQNEQTQGKRKLPESDEKYVLDIQPVYKMRRKSNRDNVVITQGIKRLNLDNLLPTTDRQEWDEKGGARYIVAGSSGRGKTYIMRSLIFAKKHIIPVAFVVSENEDVNNNYKKIIPNLFIATENSPEIAKNMIDRQKTACSNLPNANPLCLFVADDCMNDKKQFKDKNHIALFKSSRQLKMLYLLSCQYSLDLPPELRSNITGIFICRENRKEALEKIYRTFGGPIPDLDTFTQLIDQITTDYCALYIDLSSITDDWHSAVYWFRAFETRPEVVGEWSAVCLDAKRFADERYNPKYDPMDNILDR